MKYIPNYVYKTIYDIDFDTLYASGKRIILSDLDNTIAGYDELEASEKCIEWNKILKEQGFKIYLVSNNNDTRIKKFSIKFYIDGYLSKARKPFTKRLEKFLKENNIKKEEVISIGDQIVTDIVGFNSLGVDTILVKTINQKKQKWYTKINRSREKRILRKIKKVDCVKYNQIKELYE
jgi:HAD superfamily phosphatase (TIGR01668 family)